MGFWFTFFLWVGSFVLTDYFRPKLPGVEPQGQGEFKSPTATEGRPVPQIVGGTVRVEGPNVLWMGDWRAEPVTVETGIIFKRDETVGYTYSVALVLGCFMGEVAGLTGIWIGDDKVWDYGADGSPTGEPATVADVDLPELFGGEKNGGGFQGRFRVFKGTEAQEVSAFLASKSELTDLGLSRWPGMTYVVLTNADTAITGSIFGLPIPLGTVVPETGGAIVGESNGLRDISLEFAAFSSGVNGLNNDLNLTGDKHIIGRDANPIQCAYKVLTHPDFSINTGEINFANFQAAAETCYNEGIGYSRLIDTEVEAFEILAEIEKHVDGYIGPNPQNGLLEVTLARADYTPANEFQANTTNIKAIKNYAKPEWPQLKNEVKVRFLNRSKHYKEDHAIAQDMAGRLISGRPQSLTIGFPGLRDPDAANRIAARSSRGYFWPVSKFEMEIDRTGWELRPGKVIVVTHPDIEATNLLTRVTRIRTGDPIEQTIKVDVVEDVFADEVGIAAAPPDSDWIAFPDGSVLASQYVQTIAPRWYLQFLHQLANPTETRQSATLSPRIITFVKRDNPNTKYDYDWKIRGDYGSGTYLGVTTEGPISAFPPAGTLVRDVPQLQATTNNGTANEANGGAFYVQGDTISGAIGEYDPFTGTGLFVINPGAANEEWVFATSVIADSGGVFVSGVIRGIGDSPILEHLADEPVYFADSSLYIQDDALPGDTTYGYQYNLRTYGPDGTTKTTGYNTESHITNLPITRPNPPSAVLFDQLSDTTWFKTGTLDASEPVPNPPSGNPTLSGFVTECWNRAFNQENPVYAADGKRDIGVVYQTAWFTSYSPVLKWWLYNLDETPSPARSDAIASGTKTSDTNNYFVNQTINQTVFQAVPGLYAQSPFNCRFEFAFEIGASPGIAGVVNGVESRSVWVDRQVKFYPDHESKEVINDTLLLLHFDGEDGTTETLDSSIYAHQVTLAGGAELDNTAVPTTGFGGSPNQNKSHLMLPAQTSPQSPTPYCEVTDLSPCTFDQLTINPGYVVQCRFRLDTMPGDGELPLITKWRASDNQKSFWVGLYRSGTTEYMRVKISGDGSTEYVDTSLPIGLGSGVWYELAIIHYRLNYYGTNQIGFLLNGTWIERDAATEVSSLFNSAAPIRIGSDGDGNSVSVKTYIDEVRIVNLPLYKAPYTLQTAPFPGRDYRTVLLWGGSTYDGSPALQSPIREGRTEDLNRWTMDFGTRVGGSPTDYTTFIDTSVSKFGGASLYCGGVDTGVVSGSNCDGVRLTDSANAPQFALGVEDFTIECFVRFATLPNALDATNGSRLIDRFYRNSSPTWGNYGLNITGGNSLNFFVYNANNTEYNATAAAVSPEMQTLQWYHAAAVRSGNDLALFWDGKRIFYSADWFVGKDPLRSDSDIVTTLGRRYIVTGANRLAPLHGWLDEVRILCGSAEYDVTQTTVTVPTAPFPRDPILPDAPIPSPASPQGQSPQSPQGVSPASPQGQSPQSPQGVSPTPPSPQSPQGVSPTPPPSPQSPQGQSPQSPQGQSPQSPQGQSPQSPQVPVGEGDLSNWDPTDL